MISSVFVLVHDLDGEPGIVSAHSTEALALAEKARIEGLRDRVAALSEPPMTVAVVDERGSLVRYERQPWSDEQKAAVELYGRLDPHAVPAMDCARVFTYSVVQLPIDAEDRLHG
jgi:hypothetical protein